MFVGLDSGTGGVNVGVLVGVDVDGAVVIGAAPGAVIDEDGVTSPTEACTVPTVDPKGRANGDRRAEANCCADDKSAAGWEEDDCGAVDGNVVVSRIDGLNLDVAAVVHYVVVGA